MHEEDQLPNDAKRRGIVPGADQSANVRKVYDTVPACQPANGGGTAGPLVIAHYVTWYQTPACSGSWGFWQVNRPTIPREAWHFPDTRDGRGWRDLASVFHPVIGPYDSSDPHACEYHILLAKLAGLDAFVCDWYGFDPTPEHPRDHPGFMTLLRVAELLDFRVGLCWEDRSLFQHRPAVSRAGAVRRGRAILRRLEREVFTSPAYLRMDGRPVLMNFAWDPPGRGPADTTLFAHEWDQVLGAADRRPLFIHDYQSHHPAPEFEAYESVAPWGSCLHERADVPEFWPRAYAARGRGRFSFLSGTVRPGFDNRGSGGWGHGLAVDPRGDGSRYRTIWQNVLRHPVRFVQVATWNDFNEGGTIEPTRPGIAHPGLGVEGYGYRELETTQEFAARLRGGRRDPAPLRLPALLYRCRKLVARTALPDAAAWTKALDDARAALLDGHAQAARVALVRVQDALPAPLRDDPDLAICGTPS